MEEKKNRVRKIIYRDSIILLAGILYAVFVRLTGLAVPCIFRVLTGWQCPGCGITRACLSLLKGEIRTSFSYNPFLYIAGPCIIYLIVRGDLNYIKRHISAGYSGYGFNLYTDHGSADIRRCEKFIKKFIKCHLLFNRT